MCASLCWFLRPHSVFHADLAEVSGQNITVRFGDVGDAAPEVEA